MRGTLGRVRRACSDIANARADGAFACAFCDPYAKTAIAHKLAAATGHTHLTVRRTDPGGYTPVTANADSLTCPGRPGAADV